MPNRNTHYWFCFMLFVGGWGVRWEGVGVEMRSYLVAFLATARSWPWEEERK